MKTFALIAAGIFALGAPALAQQTVTSERVMPNGDVRTSTTVHDGGMGMNGGMNRAMDHSMSDRMDGRGDRTVVAERSVNYGGDGWHRGHHMRRVCVTRMHHHQMARRCWMRRR